jgi:hypothetical protein
MRKIAISFLALALAAPAWALSTKDLLSIIAMPLAVAAVSNAAGVPQSQLSDLVSTLNQANVPPTRFVEVIRYVPVALNQPDFVQYVQTQASQGVTGDALVNAIVDRLRSNYNVTPVLPLNGDPTTLVVADNYIPAVVDTTTSVGDPLAFIALPLAVAAVSDVTGVSQDQLANLVATLNNANVPPTQVVEVLRYVPVALVADNGQTFVQFVQQQTNRGITGVALVPVIVQQLQTYYPPQTQIVINAPAPQPQLQPVVVVNQPFVPPAVITRVEEVRGHPHGEQQGQLNRGLGAQNGNEVVHGEKRGREFAPAPAPVAVAPQAVPQARPAEQHGRGNDRRDGASAPMMSSSPPPPQRVPQAAPAAQPEKGKGESHGEGKDQGQGKDQGHGKGHGKD